MSKRRNPDQMLLDLAQNEGPDVVHLPYSPEFEAVCQRINPAANTEDKHRIWEKLLELRNEPRSVEATIPAQVAPVNAVRPDQSAVPARRPHGSLVPRKRAACSSLFTTPFTNFNHGRLPTSWICRQKKPGIVRRCWRTSPTRTWLPANSGSLAFFRDSLRHVTATRRCASGIGTCFRRT